MKRKRHTPEEIIKKLRETATQLAGGQSVEEVCKKLEVSPPTYHRWKEQYGGAREETVKRLKELEKENGRLKRIVADMALDNGPTTRQPTKSLIASGSNFGGRPSVA